MDIKDAIKERHSVRYYKDEVMRHIEEGRCPFP